MNTFAKTMIAVLVGGFVLCAILATALLGSMAYTKLPQTADHPAGAIWMVPEDVAKMPGLKKGNTITRFAPIEGGTGYGVVRMADGYWVFPVYEHGARMAK